MEEILDSATIVTIVGNATREVLSTMLGLEAETEESYMETAPHSNTEGVVSFVGLAGVGRAGDHWAGTGTLRCSSVAACRFASRFLMTELPSVDDEVLDAFAELTNMIIGNFKNEVEKRVGPTGLSIPTVIHGRNFSTRSLSRETWTVVPFLCGEDRIEVKICLKDREPNTFAHRYGERQEFILTR